MAAYEFFGVLLAGSFSLVYGIAGAALARFIATRRSPRKAPAWAELGSTAETDVSRVDY